MQSGNLKCKIKINTEIQEPQEMYHKKGVLKSFEKITGKYMLWSLLFNNSSVLWPAALLKKRTRHSFFSLNVERLETPILQNIYERLRLKKIKTKFKQKSIAYVTIATLLY